MDSRSFSGSTSDGHEEEGSVQDEPGVLADEPVRGSPEHPDCLAETGLVGRETGAEPAIQDDDIDDDDDDDEPEELRLSEYSVAFGRFQREEEANVLTFEAAERSEVLHDRHGVKSAETDREIRVRRFDPGAADF
jgi:hypothetical protein